MKLVDLGKAPICMLLHCCTFGGHQVRFPPLSHLWGVRTFLSWTNNPTQIHPFSCHALCSSRSRWWTNVSSRRCWQASPQSPPSSPFTSRTVSLVSSVFEERLLLWDPSTGPDTSARCASRVLPKMTPVRLCRGVHWRHLYPDRI